MNTNMYAEMQAPFTIIDSLRGVLFEGDESYNLLKERLVSVSRDLAQINSAAFSSEENKQIDADLVKRVLVDAGLFYADWSLDQEDAEQYARIGSVFHRGLITYWEYMENMLNHYEGKDGVWHRKVMYVRISKEENICRAVWVNKVLHPKFRVGIALEAK